MSEEIEVTRRSRIRWLRRKLLKLALWGDPEANFPDDLAEGYAMVDNAKRGCLEDQVELARGYYARHYLLGDLT